MIADRLADFAVLTRVPSEAAETMRLSLFDWAVCAIAGQTQPVSRVIVEYALATGAGPASIVGTSARVPAREAALANGTISHALDFDDTHFAHIGHPSVAVVPAALAATQATGASGANMLDAALIGAEASVRVGLWLGRVHYDTGFHQTATAGTFGAALAAARVLGLSTRETRHAIGIAAGSASGLKAQFGSMGKPLNAGIAASNGVEAAMLAAAGLEPAAGVLDGPQGFGATHAGEGNLVAFEGLGDEWLMTGVSYKFHACCHGLHAMLEAMLEVGECVEDNEIAQLDIMTHPRWKSVCNQPDPQDGLQCKFSYRHTAAMALLGLDTADLENYSDVLAQEAQLVALRRKVNVTFSEDMSETAARVTVHFEDGTVASASHDLATPRAQGTMVQRLRSKAATLIGQERAAALWAAVDAGPDLDALLGVLAGATAQEM